MHQRIFLSLFDSFLTMYPLCFLFCQPPYFLESMPWQSSTDPACSIHPLAHYPIHMLYLCMHNHIQALIHARRKRVSLCPPLAPVHKRPRSAIPPSSPLPAALSRVGYLSCSLLSRARARWLWSSRPHVCLPPISALRSSSGRISSDSSCSISPLATMLVGV